MKATTFHAHLQESIKSKDIKVLSCDFFDTLMSRRVPRPADIFLILGERILEAGNFSFNVTASRFQSLRVQAEALARKQGPLVEIGIDDIYAQFPDSFFRCPIQDVIDLEIAVEKEFLFPVAEMVDVLKTAARRGKKIIVVSDIYFKASHLKEFWGDATPGIDIQFFTSSDLKSGKYDRLFEIVLKKLGTSPNAVLHTGDNYVSDVSRPASLGIKTAFVPHGSGNFFRMLEQETASTASKLGKAPDLGLTAIRSKVTLHQPAADIDRAGFAQYGAQILGPVLSTFIKWIELSAVAEQSEVVMPLMREGHIISKLLHMGDSGLTIRPAYLSRRIMFQCGLVNADRRMLESLRFGNLKSTVAEYLALLGLYPGDVPALRPFRTRYISDDGVFSTAVNALIDSGAVSLVRERAVNTRQGVIRHFVSLATVDGKLQRKIALVDVGWNGTIQRLLQQLLIEENIPVQLTGLYMMTTRAVNELVFQNVLAKGFFVDGGFPSADYVALSRTLEIFEQSCAPAHGSVACHDVATGHPVLQPDQIPAEQRADIDDVQDGIVLFHTLFLRNAPATISREQLDAVSESVRGILRRAMLAPTPAEAQLFSHWVHDDNLGSGGTMPVLGTSAMRSFIKYKTLEQHAATPMDELYWPAAALVITDPSRAQQFAHTMLHGIGCAEFDNDTGLSSEVARAVVPAGANVAPSYDDKSHQTIFRNSAGKSYLRFELPADRNSTLRWTPMSQPCDVVIDFILVSFHHDDGLVTQARLSGDSTFAEAVRCEGMNAVDIACWRGKGAGSAFYFDDLRKLGVASTGRLVIEIACSVTALNSYMPLMSDNAKRSLNLAANASITTGVCNLDLFNGEALVQCPLVADSTVGINLSGWMVDPALSHTAGDFYARLTNMIGESRFIPMTTIPRADVAQHFNNELALRSGFKISDCIVPEGEYSISVIRATADRCLISKQTWNVSVGAVL